MLRKVSNAVMTPASSFSVEKPHFPFFDGSHLGDVYEICDAAGVFNRFEVACVRPATLRLEDYHETLTLSETIRNVVSILESLEAIYPKKRDDARTSAPYYGPSSGDFATPTEDRPEIAAFPDSHFDAQIRGLGDTKLVRLCIPRLGEIYVFRNLHTKCRSGSGFRTYMGGRASDRTYPPRRDMGEAYVSSL